MKSIENQSTTATDATTTIIWGRWSKVYAIATERGATPVTYKTNDGQKITSVVRSFEGGYDDYYGSCGYAEIPGDYPGKTTRFCARPGQWLDGVRV